MEMQDCSKHREQHMQNLEAGELVVHLTVLKAE